MKRLIFFLLILIFNVNFVSSQLPLKFGATGGLNVSKYTTALLKSRVGFHVGGKLELDLSELYKGVYCEADVLLSLKGAKADWGDLGSLDLNPYYLELPLLGGYKFEVLDNLKVFAAFGPYFAFGLFGKEKDSYVDDVGHISTETYNIFSGTDAIRRFDIGVNFKTGFEIKNKYQFCLGYEWGLIPVDESSDDEVDLGLVFKNRNFGLSFTYLF